MNEGPPRVVVAGGGLAGLASAYRLTRPRAGAALEVTLLEAGHRLGGTLHALDVDGLPLEGGADSFVVRKPWAVDLCAELGLGDDLIHPGASGASVWARGRLVPYPERSAFGVPSQVEELLRWPGMSFGGRIRAVMDLYRPRRKDPADESIGHLVRRRMGRQCAEVLVSPLLAGINSGDADRLSVRATFPELAVWEAGHGSLIRGAKAARRAVAQASGGGALFATLSGGLERLTGALADAILAAGGAIRTDAAAEAVDAVGSGGGFVVRNGNERLHADALILATPAFETARLVAGRSADAAAELAAIPYGSSAVVALAYPPGSADRLPDATGFIVPPGSVAGGSPTVVTACTWVSRKWPSAAFGDRAVIRAFVGRAGDEAALELSDPELVAAVARDIGAIAPLGTTPDGAAVMRWERSMPQYELGHLDVVDRIEGALARDVPGLFVTGSAYRGVGIADCVRQANEAAARVLEHLGGATPTADADGRRVEAT